MDIAIVGAGKIAADQHVPALAASADFRLVAAASPAGRLHGLAHFPSLAALLAEGPEVEAVAVCTPPQVRHAVAREALLAGKHVLLEKPPGATVSEVQDLIALARRCGRSLYAAWHSRHAPGVEPARAWLAERRLSRADIVWREDVRRWHPGQDWIFEAGGLGVFDPAINALSIASHILPPFFVKAAALSVPAGRAAPIAAALAFEIEGGAPMSADFDFREAGPQTWDLTAETADGQSLRLSQGGAALAVNGREVPLEPAAEYAALYRRFAELIAEGGVDVDLRPLQLVADAFLLGRHTVVEAFAF